jgi:hypothetical protein
MSGRCCLGLAKCLTRPKLTVFQANRCLIWLNLKVGWTQLTNWPWRVWWAHKIWGVYFEWNTSVNTFLLFFVLVDSNHFIWVEGGDAQPVHFLWKNQICGLSPRGLWYKLVHPRERQLQNMPTALLIGFRERMESGLNASCKSMCAS